VARIPWGNQPSWQASVSKSPPRHPFGLLPANNQITAPRVRHGNAKAFLRTDVCAPSKNLRRASRKLPEKLVRSSRRSSPAKRQWVPERERVCVAFLRGRERERDEIKADTPRVAFRLRLHSGWTKLFLSEVSPVLCFSLLLREIHFHYLGCRIFV
jgi:hypothetical protein